MLGKADNELIWPLINALEIHRVPGNELAPSKVPGDVALTFTLSMDGNDYGHHVWHSDATKADAYRKLVETLGTLLVKHSDEEVWFAPPTPETSK